MGNALRTAEIIAHRGIRDRYPENSLPAFEAALDAGADAVELDVHATRDGIVVVHHDPILPRVVDSPIAGRPIASTEFRELTDFELAPGVGLPALEDVLQAIGARATLYIEIKAPNIEALVAKVIASVPTASRCAVHSFDHRIVLRLASLAPGIPRGILEVGYPAEPPSVLAAARARDLWQACEFIDGELVDSIHRVGGRVIAWTCDDPAQWARFHEIGVDSICTDRTAACATWRRDIEES
jgi:glycerophosphoryl diester phosphodiesterase